jgi:hypothetical protein
LWQNSHLKDCQAPATYISLLFPFLLAPPEIALIIPFDHGKDWLATSNMCVYEYAWIICAHHVMYFNSFTVIEK